MNGEHGRSSPLGFAVARGILTLFGGAVGFLAGAWLLERQILIGPNDLIYLSLLGLLLGYLLSDLPARWWARIWTTVRTNITNTPPEAVLAAGTGATVALLITVLLNNVLVSVPGFTWYWSLLIATVLVVASSWFFVANRGLFTVMATRQPAESGAATTVGRPRVVDTSAIIDGRIVDVIEANFLDGKLLVPRFVLGELQHIADSEEPQRRKRGRRGLEMLDRMVELPSIVTEVIVDDGDEGPVDERLIQVCQQRGADLITTDYNLSRVAALQGLNVLNVNGLANALRATYLPGERLSLNIVREGREQGQGLAYLEDGTMVVVEDAAGLVGRTIETVVTSNLQTTMGRMIFARPDASATAQN